MKKVAEEIRYKNPETGEYERVNRNIEEAEVKDYVVTSNSSSFAKGFVWDVLIIVEVLLLLRFLFMLFGANLTTFTRILYSVTELFIAPFRGVFGMPQIGESYFASAVLVAMVVYALIARGIVALIDITSYR